MRADAVDEGDYEVGCGREIKGGVGRVDREEKFGQEEWGASKQKEIEHEKHDSTALCTFFDRGCRFNRL